MAVDLQADREFANALVELEILSLDRVREGLRVQRVQLGEGKEAQPLEQILVDLKLITAEQATQARAHRARKKLFELIDDGLKASAPEIPGFEIVRRIGSGGMGSVYLARQLSIDRPVAIKVLNERLAADEVFIKRFQSEARTAAKISHPGIITAYDVGQHKGVHYLVMEYVDGTTAEKLLRERKRLDEKQVVEIGLQVARALEVAQRAGVIHRDVKPDNIMIARDGTVKLCDLGLAREIWSAGTEPTAAAGTPRYIAPEQARGVPDLDVRCDLYALGATMYHLVTGEIPFRAETSEQMMLKHVAEALVPPRERYAEVSERLSTIIVKLMSKRREDRYQTPGELMAALQALAEAKPRTVEGKPAGTPAPARPPVSRRAAAPPPPEPSRGAWPLVAAGVAVAVAAVLATVYLARSPRTAPTGTGEVAPPPAEPAKDELAELLGQQEADPAMNRIAEIIKLYEAYCDRHRGTRWEGEALKEREKYFARAEEQAGTALAAIREMEGPLRAAEKWRDVLKAYEEFPDRFLGTTAVGAEVKEERARVAGRAAEKLATDKARISEMIRQRRYDEALALLAQMETYALESALPDLAAMRERLRKLKGERSSGVARQVADEYAAVEERVREYLKARDYRLAVGALSRFLATPWTEAQRPCVLLPNVDYGAFQTTLRDAEKALAERGDAPQAAALWEAAAQTCETFGGDPASPAEMDTAQRVMLDLRNAIALELFRLQALAGLDLWVQGRERVTLGTYGSRAGRFEVRDGKLAFCPDGKPAVTLDPVRDLQEPDLVAMAARSLDSDPAVALKRSQESPKFLVRTGLFYHYSGTGMAYADRAADAFRRAVEKGARGVRVYMADQVGPARVKEEERLAGRFAEAESLAKEGQWKEAAAICEELLRSNHPWVAKNQHQIGQLQVRVLEAMEGERKLAATYFGKVETLSGSRLRVSYDFADAAQLQAFETVALPTQGKWFENRGGLESSKVASATRWIHRVKGDVEIEYALTPLEGVPQNIVTSLYYNGAPRDDPHYSVSFAFDLVTGAADPRNILEQQMGLPQRLCVIKYPIVFDKTKAQDRAEWNKVRERVVGSANDDRELKPGKSSVVKIVRQGKAIRVWLDGKVAWEGEDAEYNEGFILFYSDCRVRIDDLSIVFRPAE